jgi:hypothetical protein
MPYEANEEPEITYTGSINNAEIICTSAFDTRPLARSRRYGLRMPRRPNIAPVATVYLNA